MSNYRTTLNPILREQDIHLSNLEKGIDRLHMIGNNINDELKSQNNQLDNLEIDIENNQNKINKVNFNITKIIKEVKN